MVLSGRLSLVGKGEEGSLVVKKISQMHNEVVVCFSQGLWMSTLCNPTSDISCDSLHSASAVVKRASQIAPLMSFLQEWNCVTGT